MRIAITALLVLVSVRVEAQTWTERQAVTHESSVRMYEIAGKGWSFVDGKLLLVKDKELALLQNRPIVIPKAPQAGAGPTARYAYRRRGHGSTSRGIGLCILRRSGLR